MNYLTFPLGYSSKLELLIANFDLAMFYRLCGQIYDAHFSLIAKDNRRVIPEYQKEATC